MSSPSDRALGARPRRLSCSGTSDRRPTESGLGFGQRARLVSPARPPVQQSATLGYRGRDQRRARNRSAPKSATPAALPDTARNDDRRSGLVLKPTAPPRTLKTGMGCIGRADQTTITKPVASPPRSRSRRCSAPHEVVNLAPMGYQQPRRTLQRSPASSLSTRRTAFWEPAPTRWRREAGSAYS
jgi:hypothetical protein